MVGMNERQRDAARLVGKRVRFHGLPLTMEPTPILVIGATPDGMVQLEGWAGNFAPHLFQIIPPSVTISQSCSWCDELNEIPDERPVTCNNCGHRADRPRMFCDCARCAQLLASVLRSGAREMT